MPKSVSETEKFLQNIVQPLGYEIVDLEFIKGRDKTSLTLLIYREGGITLSDCEKVHRAIDGPLDEFDPTDGKAYTLNVSSPGLDRAFKRSGDFVRNLGKEITVKFYAPIEGKKAAEGVLKAFDDKTVTLIQGANEIVIEREKTAKISLKLDF